MTIQITMGHWIFANIHDQLGHITDLPSITEHLYFHKHSLDTSQIDA